MVRITQCEVIDRQIFLYAFLEAWFLRVLELLYNDLKMGTCTIGS